MISRGVADNCLIGAAALIYAIFVATLGAASLTRSIPE